MARKIRFAIPDIPQLITQRGNNGQACFNDAHDYTSYLAYMSEAAQRYLCAVHAYVLMPSHVYLLITPREESAASRFMQHIGRGYVQYFNLRHDRSGTLWEGRYKASLVDAQRYLLVCHRYIELNPVRDALTNRPEHYRWSSFQRNALGKVDGVVTAHECYLNLGSTDEQRRNTYRRLFDSPLKNEDLLEIRETLNQEVVLGREQFREEIGILLPRRVRPARRGRPRKQF